jgi:hypothetical protein
MRLNLVFIILLALLIGLAAGLTFPEPDAAAAPVGRILVNDIWGLAPRTLTITGSQTLTPTVSEYHFNNATAVLTLTLWSGNARPGDRLRLVSLVATDTVILTTNTSLAAAKTITTYDILEFEFFNSLWVEAVHKDNEP